MQDVAYEDLEAILRFIYEGVVYIDQTRLSSLLQTADGLRIRGLAEDAPIYKVIYST